MYKGQKVMKVFFKSGSLVLVMLLTTVAHAAPGVKKLTVTSDAFDDGEAVPDWATCDGEDRNPQISWSKVPAGTRSIAVIVSDPDAPDGTFYHWARIGIRPKVRSLEEGSSGDDDGDLENDFGELGYNGPCPSDGSEHRYNFTVYALSRKLQVDITAAELAERLTRGSLKKRVIGSGTVMGTYAGQLSEEEQCYEDGGSWECTTEDEEEMCSCQ